jgi:hypothetical protein
MIRTKEINIFSCTILIGLLCVSGLAFGAGAPVTSKNPCSEDMAKFCKDVKPGQRAMVDCLERHESQLSDACRDYEAKMEKVRTESREAQMQQMRVRQACKDDVSKFCNDPKLGSAGLTACLKEHGSEVSVPCKDALDQAQGGAEEKTQKK